jgi:hypothetical protein
VAVLPRSRPKRVIKIFLGRPPETLAGR